MKLSLLLPLFLFVIFGKNAAQTCLPGGITFTSQSQINNFAVNYPGCTEVLGGVTVNGSDITNLNGLSQITDIGDFLEITSNPLLTSLAGLTNLSSIGTYLYIYENPGLTSLSGLDDLSAVGEDVSIENNEGLLNLSGLGGLTSIPSSLDVNNNNGLTSLAGLDNITSIGGGLTISGNALLTDLSALDNLASIGDWLDISSNAQLTNLGGLDNLGDLGGWLNIANNNVLSGLGSLYNLVSINGEINIINNPTLSSLYGLDNIDHSTITDLFLQNSASLSSCDVASICDYLAIPANPTTISGNATGCDSRVEVEIACTSMLSCTNLTNPTNGAVNVPVTTPLTWAAASGATGYKLTIGTSPGGTQILNNVDVGNVTTYDPAGNLPPNANIYVRIVPYDAGGDATGCGEESFMTGTNTCLSSGITFSTQAQIDAFPVNYPGCTEILGNVTIQGNNITNLNGLSQVNLIDGNLLIQQNPNLANLNGLQNLHFVNEFLGIYLNNTLTDISVLINLTTLPLGLGVSGNPLLASLDGLDNLTSMGGAVLISGNAALNDMTALSNVTTISGYLRVISNGSLQNLNGLQGLTTVTSQLEIIDNAQLQNLTGLNNLASVGRWLIIENNPQLNTLAALANLNTINANNSPAGYLYVINNDNLLSLSGLDNLDDTKITNLKIESSANLSFCNVTSICNYLADPANPATISGNAAGCADIPDVWVACGFPPSCTSLTNPVNGATNVPVTSTLTWAASAGATGYRLTVGTTSSGNDILSNVDVGNVITYDPPGDFPINSTIFVSITPYNAIGDAVSCVEESFMTQTNTCLPGGIIFTSQAQINAFPANYPGCTHILGDVNIVGTGITNLNGLSQIQSIGGLLEIYGSSVLTSLAGLSNLNSIGGSLDIYFLANLPNLNGLNNLTSIGGYLNIFNNGDLANLDGLESLISVGGYLWIRSNPDLTSLSGLDNLSAVGGYLRINNNGALTSLSGLDNIDHATITNLIIQSNGTLNLCEVQSICDYLAIPSNPATISGNATGCASRPEVEAACVFTPPNNDCVNAIEIPVNSSSCTPSGNYSTVGATNSLSNACMASLYKDTWYKFTPTDYLVTAEISGFWSTAKVELFDACGGNSIDCQTGGSTFTVIWNTLIAGNTYYFRIGVLPSQGEGNIDLCLLQYVQPSLSITTTPACAGNDGTATATVTGGQPPYDFTWTDPNGIEYYDFNNTSGVSIQTDCVTGTWHVYMTDWFGAGETETFNIQGSPPSNNECSGAITLSMGNGSCTPIGYSIECATVSPQPQPCTGGLKDIWFSTTATQAGFNFTTGDLPSGGYYWLEIYSGDCLNLNYVECIEEVQPDSNYFINSGPGTIYLRLEYFGSEGVVNFCVWELPTPLNNDCANAIEIPVNVGSCTPGGNFSTVGATNSLANACMASIYEDTWYKFTPQTSEVTLEGVAFSSVKIELFDACGGNSMYCSAKSSNFTLTWPGLTPNQEYWFRIGVVSGEGEIDLCIWESNISPPTLLSLTPTTVQIKYHSPIDPATATATNLKIWGDETGQRAGTYTVAADTVTFTASDTFRAGELIHITSMSGLQFMGGVATTPFSWVRQSPVTNPTAAVFDTTGTGIILPAAAYGSSASYNATMADVNRDGLQDVVFRYHASYGAATNVLVYLRNANGTFAAPATYTNAESHSGLVGTPDLNNDGYPDLVITHNVPSRIQVRLNNGSGGFGAATLYTVTNYCNGARIADMDNDGDLDIIAYAGNSSLSQNTISVLKNNGDGTFAAQVTTNTSVFGTSCQPADLDNDGDMDLVYTSNTAFGSSKVFRVYQNDGTGALTLNNSETNNLEKTLLPAFDYNADGNVDLITRNPSTEIYLNNSGISYSLSTPTLLSAEEGFLLSGDLDGDGDLDAIIPNSYNGTNWNTLPVKILLNNGAGLFTTNTTSLVLPTFLWGSTLTDYDSDGDLDHIYLDPATGEIKVLRNEAGTVPPCTNLTDPANGATNVPITTALTWAAANAATGYRLTIGTTPGGTDILNNFDVGNVTTYNPAGNFPYSSTIYVKITPYNADGDAVGCAEESFMTEANPAPANDECANATELIMEADACTLTAYSNVGATPSSNAAPCSGGNIPDIWFTTIVNNSNEFNVSIGNLPPVGDDFLMEIYDNDYCDTEMNNSIFCGIILANSTYNIPAGPGAYTIRIESFGVGDIELCVWEPVTSPYDDCPGAAITVGNSCNYTSIDNTNWVESFAPSACGSLEFFNDGYFQVNIPQSGDFHIDFGNVPVGQDFEVYQGISCLGTPIYCGFTTGNTQHTVNAPAPGWYLIRTGQEPGDPTGDIQICVWQSQTPPCTNLTTPTNAATNVPVTTSLTWAAATGATGYRLTAGTTPGGTNILNNVDVGNVTTYDPPGDLPYSTTVYVTITPYNANGDASGCPEESFTTASCNDLVIEIISTFISGNNINYTYRITNNGPSSVNLAGPTSSISDNLGFQRWISTDSIFGNGNDLPHGGSLLTNAQAIVLGPGAFTTLSSSFYNMHTPGYSNPNHHYILIELTNLGNVLPCDIVNNHSTNKIGCTDPAAHNFDAQADINDGYCQTCSDGIQNGDETAVDCGGVLCQPCSSPPSCTQLSNPANNSINVPISTALTWATSPTATGYRLSASTTPGGTDILNNVDVGNVTTYDPPGNLPSGTIIFVKITPYNGAGDALGCTEESFTTASECPTGDLVFATQAEIDSFPILYPNCTVLTGNVCIGDCSYPHESTDISNLNGLSQLTSISGTLAIFSNPNLANLTGLGNLATIGGSFSVTSNAGLASYVGLGSLNSVGGDMYIIENAALTNLNGLGGLASIGGGLYIVGNSSLVDLTALVNLMSINGYLSIGYNDALASLSGLENINPVTITNLLIQNSSQLSFCEVQSICEYLAIPSNPATITGNAIGCADRPAVEAACMAVPLCTNLINPANGATNVPITTSLTWAAATGATGYRLTAGTTSGGTDILNNVDVGNVTTYDPPGNLPYSTAIYVTIMPYNADGDATGCAEESFTTEDQCPPGDVTLLTQVEVDTFAIMYPNCTQINGSLTIGNFGYDSDIDDLSGLSSLTTANNVFVYSNPLLTDLTGLDSFTTIFSELFVFGNNGLTNLTGLGSLNNVGGIKIAFNNNLVNLVGLGNITGLPLDLQINFNPALTSLAGLSNLTFTGLDLGLTYNNVLSDLTALSNLDSVGGHLTIGYCPALPSLTGLENLTVIVNELTIINNSSLTSLLDLNSLDTIGGNLEINGNPLLSSCEAQAICDYLSLPPGTVTIQNNAVGCNNPAEVESFCMPPSCTNLIIPLNGATNVPMMQVPEWGGVPGASGYLLNAGTSPGGSDILNHLDVGNVTFYNAGALPCGETVYFSIIPYNGTGDAAGCPEESFSTVGCPQNLVINLFPIPIGIYQAVVAIISNGIVAANTTVVFNAGNNIVLDSAFLVELAGIFSANIDPSINFLPGNQTGSVKGKPHGGKSGSDMDFDVNLAKRDFTKHYLVANLELPDDAFVVLSVLDSNGNTITQTQPDLFLTKGQSLFLIDLPDSIPPGEYFVWIDSGSQQIMKKVVLVN